MAQDVVVVSSLRIEGSCMGLSVGSSVMIEVSFEVDEVVVSAAVMEAGVVMGRTM